MNEIVFILVINWVADWLNLFSFSSLFPSVGIFVHVIDFLYFERKGKKK